jgi:erythronate-4-phosphate dehydrogenase
MKILIVADTNIPFVESMYHPFAEVRLVDGNSITSHTVRDADILLVRSVTRIGKDILEGSKVRFVGAVTSGYDHVDLQYLASKGIRFAYAPGCNSNSVAEYIVAAILVLSKRLRLDLQLMTLGVVGVGNVGGKVVRKAAALGMRVLQNDPPLQRKSCSPELVSLDELMEADIITLHVPLTDEGSDATHYLFDEKRIAAMKPGSILINTSRGQVVKTEALRKALCTGHLRTAVLDVWEKEPEINVDVMSMSAIGTPHIAGYTVEGKTNGAVMIYESVCQCLHAGQNWSSEGKIPPPEALKICITSPSDGSTKLIHEIVRKCYDIESDDARLREVFKLNPEERKRHFNKLRAEYPLRREFAATKVEVPKSNSALVNCLNNLGYSVIEK